MFPVTNPITASIAFYQSPFLKRSVFVSNKLEDEFMQTSNQTKYKRR